MVSLFFGTDTIGAAHNSLCSTWCSMLFLSTRWSICNFLANCLPKMAKGTECGLRNCGLTPSFRCSWALNLMMERSSCWKPHIYSTIGVHIVSISSRASPALYIDPPGGSLLAEWHNYYDMIYCNVAFLATCVASGFLKSTIIWQMPQVITMIYSKLFSQLDH